MTDGFWKRVEPLILIRQRLEDQNHVRKAGGGRKPKDPRLVFEAIVYVLRTGCQWKAVPAEHFRSASAIHARFLDWEKAGFFHALWARGLAEYDDFEGIAWRWQNIDGAMMKVPTAQSTVGPNPTDRGKNGSKRHLLMDGRGVPLSLAVTEVNRHDVSQLEAVLDAVVVKRPRPPKRRSKHLCADAVYTGALRWRSSTSIGHPSCQRARTRGE